MTAKAMEEPQLPLKTQVQGHLSEPGAPPPQGTGNRPTPTRLCSGPKPEKYTNTLKLSARHTLCLPPRLPPPAAHLAVLPLPRPTCCHLAPRARRTLPPPASLLRIRPLPPPPSRPQPAPPPAAEGDRAHGGRRGDVPTGPGNARCGLGGWYLGSQASFWLQREASPAQRRGSERGQTEGNRGQASPRGQPRADVTMCMSRKS